MQCVAFSLQILIVSLFSHCICIFYSPPPAVASPLACLSRVYFSRYPPNGELVRRLDKEETKKHRRNVAFVTWKMPKLAQIAQKSSGCGSGKVFFASSSSILFYSFLMDFMQRIDSILLCACSVTDHRWRYSLLGEDTSDQEPVTDVTLPALFCFYPFWRHLVSTDEKTHGTWNLLSKNEHKNKIYFIVIIYF